MHRSSSPDPASVRREIVEKALAHLGDAEFEDLLKSFTPKLLSTDVAWAASTVRYQFGRHDAADDPDGGRLAFQRRDLGLEMVRVALEDSVVASETGAEALCRAAARLDVGSSLDEVVADVMAHVGDFLPGASDHDVTPRQRMYHLALALCDEDAEAARILRLARGRQIQAYARVCEVLLDALGRDLRPDRDGVQLADAVYSLLDGHLTRLRFDPRSPTTWLADAVIGVFSSFTVDRRVEADGSRGPSDSPARRAEDR
jgi:hypothetical protein